jgi:hypothetical protein
MSARVLFMRCKRAGFEVSAEKFSVLVKLKILSSYQSFEDPA